MSYSCVVVLVFLNFFHVITLYSFVTRILFFPCQVFNWLLCNVIQTTSLHDILWHFVASLTPSPCEPEEEEEEDNKGNKEIVEQVCITL